MAFKNKKRLLYLIRKERTRKKIKGSEERPRLNVFKSCKHIYAQIIVDSSGRTLVSASTMDKGIKTKIKNTGNIEAAKKIGRAHV